MGNMSMATPATVCPAASAQAKSQERPQPCPSGPFGASFAAGSHWALQRSTSANRRRAHPIDHREQGDKPPLQSLLSGTAGLGQENDVGRGQPRWPRPDAFHRVEEGRKSFDVVRSP